MSSQPFPWRIASIPPYVQSTQSFLPGQSHHVKMQTVSSSSAYHLGVNGYWNLTHAPLTKSSTPMQDYICLGKRTSYFNLHKSTTWVSSTRMCNMHYMQPPKTFESLQDQNIGKRLIQCVFIY